MTVEEVIVALAQLAAKGYGDTPFKIFSNEVDDYVVVIDIVVTQEFDGTIVTVGT